MSERNDRDRIEAIFKAAGGWLHEAGTVGYTEHCALSVASLEAFYAAAYADGERAGAKERADMAGLVAEFERDAGRYAWIRDYADVILDMHVWVTSTSGNRIHIKCPSRSELDQAVDAGIALTEVANANG